MVPVDDTALTSLARELARIRGVVAVALGGSRARGTHRPDSDVDLGLYYRGDVDVAALRTLAARVADAPVEVTPPGGWGPWVDGGGWLTVAGQRVDWIYRDLDRVHQVWADCRAGRYQIGVQAGHPLGFYSYGYAGEVALCRILTDPSGELSTLRDHARDYPAPLGDALVAGLWEAGFATDLARYGATRDDPAYAAGCLFRAVGVACHALHGYARQWLINEKGMVAATGRLPVAPPGFAERAHAVLAAVGDTPERIERTVEAASALVSEVVAATRG